MSHSIFSGENPGRTLFMAASNRAAVLITRTRNKMRRRSLIFSDEHAALDWCLDCRATFVLTPADTNPKLN
jgi:hypothetical protein